MTDYIRISFNKDHWPFVSGDDAILKRRCGDWFVAKGVAVQIGDKGLPECAPPKKTFGAKVKK
jgi:hypothetical protein